MYPMESVEVKRTLPREAVRDHALVMMDHDPIAFAVYLREGDKGEVRLEAKRR